MSNLPVAAQSRAAIFASADTPAEKDGGRAGTPDGKFPCNWITVTGGPMCVGEGGTIVLGPKHLKGQNVKDVIEREAAGGRTGDAPVPRPPKRGFMSLVTNRELGLAHLPPKVKAVARRAKAALDSAVKSLAETGQNRTVKKLRKAKEAMADMATASLMRACENLMDADAFLQSVAKDSGGKVAEKFVSVTRLLLPIIMPPDAMSIPGGMKEMVPAIKAYSAIPGVAVSVAVARVAKRLGLKWGKPAEKVVKSKRQSRLAKQASDKKEISKLKSKLRSLGAAKFGDGDDARIEAVLRKEFAAVAAWYEAMLKENGFVPGRAGSAAFSGEDGTPDKEHPCNWITLNGGPMCVGEGGTILIGPAHLQGRNAKDVISKEHHGRIDAASSRHAKKADGAESEGGLPPESAAAVKDAHSHIGDVKDSLRKAGEAGKAGLKHIRGAMYLVSNLATDAMARANDKLADPDKAVQGITKAHGGTRAAHFLTVAKSVLPTVAKAIMPPDMIAAASVPSGLSTAAPFVKLYGSIPAAALAIGVAKLAERLGLGGKPSAESPPAEPKPSKSHTKRLKREADGREIKKLKARLGGMKREGGKAVPFSDGDESVADRRVRKAILEAFKPVARKYAGWLKRREADIKQSLKPLDKKKVGKGAGAAAFGDEGGTPDKEHPCNWITITGGPMCIGAGGTIVLGPDHLKGKSAKDIMSAEHHGRIAAASARHEKKDDGGGPKKDPDTKMPPRTAAVVQQGKENFDKANQILDRAGAAGAAGKKHLKAAASFLVAGAATAMIHAQDKLTRLEEHVDEKVKERYGHKAAEAVKVAKEFLPDMILDVPGGLDKMVPAVEVVLGTMVAAAGLEIFKQTRRAFQALVGKKKEAAEPESKSKSKSHLKRQLRAAIQSGGDKKEVHQLRRQLAEVSRLEKSVKEGDNVTLSSDGGEGSDPVKEVVQGALRDLMRKYAAWLKRREGALRRDLKPLKGHDFPSALAAGDKHKDERFAPKDARFDADGREYVRGGDGKFATTGTAGDAKPETPTADPAHEAKVAAAADHTLEEGRSRVAKAMDAFKAAAGAVGKAAEIIPGVRQLRKASAFAGELVKKAADGMGERYGKMAGRGVMLGGALIANNPLVSPPWLLALPGGTLLGALPFVAVAEAVHQARRAGRAVGFDDAPAPSPDEAMGVMRGVWEEYLNYLREHAAEIKESFAPLKGVEFSQEDDAAGTFPEYAGRLVDDAVRLSRELADGGISLPEWQGRMCATLAPSPFRAAFAVRPGNVSPAAWAAAEAQSRALVSHIAAFADRLANFEEDWGDGLLKRTALYAKTAAANLEEQRRLAAVEGGETEETRVPGDACCEECRRHAEKGRQPIGSQPAKGDCPCATECGCTFQFSRPD